MFTDSVRAVRRVTNRRGSRDRSIIVHVESRMAEEIRRRRRMENSLLDEEESDGPTTTDDVLADEPVLGLAHTGPQFPLLFRPRTRTLSSTRSSISEFGDHYEHESLLHPEKLAVDPSLNWLQRTQKSLRGDFSSICLLLFLYLLQGIPLGLIAAIPLVLSSKNASYGQQAVFSFAYWPFSLKLLWAPIVDSVYWKRMGRRKSWMVPCQYLIGTFMLVLSYKVADIMGDNDTQSSGKAPNVVFLMLVFLPLNFLAATQDIAVDGWALTMLSRKNVGYASTCNAVGQTAGFFLGNVVYLTLDSPDFANRFFRSEPQPYGLVSLSGFVFFWGWVFLVTTTLVLIFKKEVDHSITPSSPDEGEELELGIVDTYAVLWKIIRLKPMLWLLIVLLTGKIAFAATDGITGLKLIGMGMPKDKLSSMAVFLTPLQVLLPWMIGKYTAGPRPLNVFLLAYPYRIFMGGVFAALVWWTPSFRLPGGDFPLILYAIWVAGYCFHQVASYCMFVSMMAFNAQISDPKIGGTYMTLLNTLNNLGGNWPVTLILSLTDYFTFRDCVVKNTKTVLYSCNTKALVDQCTKGGDVCEVHIDGYYIAVALCSVIGIIWFKALFSKIKYFQKIPRSEWSVIKK